MSVIITHNCGFFSCCSVRLFHIIEFINKYKKFPDNVDSSSQFEWYKTKNKDITFEYFENYENVQIIYNEEHITYDWDSQFYDYSKLDIFKIYPIIVKYFSLSAEVNNIVYKLQKKYVLEPKNICVLFHRGNDKATETKIPNYEEYLKYAFLVLEKNPNIRFFIQSDETNFIQFMTKIFPHNSFYMSDEIRHMNKCNNTVDKVFTNRIEFYSKHYLAITYIMSQCQYIICGTGNCSIWIVLYRGNSNNICQYLNGTWINNL